MSTDQRKEYLDPQELFVMDGYTSAERVSRPSGTIRNGRLYLCYFGYICREMQRYA